MTIRRTSLAAGLALALAVAGCHNDELFPPTVPGYAGGALFQRYVAMGNSITMGIQAGGINDSTQKQAYPVLVAVQMGGNVFYYPRLNMPGCPPPYSNVFTRLRVSGDTVSTTCLFRASPIPPYISNVAVSGAEAIDLLENGPTAGTHSNPLTQLALGGRTQVEAMMDARPTFVSVWIGDNEILQAAFASDTTIIPDSATFATTYKAVLDSITKVGAKALFIGVGAETILQTIPPFWSRGSTYYGYYLAGAFAPAPFTVTANCAPARGDSVLVPFPFGLALI